MATAQSTKPIRFRKVTDALAAYNAGTLPKGTKLVIGATSTRLVKTTKHTQDTFFEFAGSPAQFAKLLLGKSAATGLRVEIEQATSEPTGTTSEDE